jgi:hypothetical protein
MLQAMNTDLPRAGIIPSFREPGRGRTVARIKLRMGRSCRRHGEITGSGTVPGAAFLIAAGRVSPSRLSVLSHPSSAAAAADYHPADPAFKTSYPRTRSWPRLRSVFSRITGLRSGPLSPGAACSTTRLTLGPPDCLKASLSPAGAGRLRAIATPNLHDLSWQSLIRRLQVVASLRPWLVLPGSPPGDYGGAIRATGMAAVAAGTRRFVNHPPSAPGGGTGRVKEKGIAGRKPLPLL